jgi:hypothetical protein
MFWVNTLQRITQGGSVETLGFFQHGENVAAIHWQSGTKPIVTGLPFYSKPTPGLSGTEMAMKVRAALLVRKREGYIHCGLREVTEDGQLGEMLEADQDLVPEYDDRALPVFIQESFFMQQASDPKVGDANG